MSAISDAAIRRQSMARDLTSIGPVTELHTAESVFDALGVDTGAEGVVAFIGRRTDYGSYHVVADRDSRVTAIPYARGAYHDRTGTNPTAMALSFACRTTDWARMTPEHRWQILRQGAHAWADMETWKRTHRRPATALRRITKAQSDAGISGFVAHGDRDPGRRTDPGVKAPALFPWDEFFDHCRAVTRTPAPRPATKPAAPTAPRPTPEEDPMADPTVVQKINEIHHILKDPDLFRGVSFAQHQRDLIGAAASARDSAAACLGILKGIDLAPDVRLADDQVIALADAVAGRLSSDQARVFLDALAGRLQD